ncbi:MAG TPA: low temperature requirement protein A [Iamia sp.]
MTSAVRLGNRFRLPGAQPIVRDPDEEHRAATPLELLFDLCFVVAVAQAAAAYHHELVEGHVLDGVVGFAGGFFAVWWGWMNFTWFSSAHDRDDVLHRVLTLTQMAGALVLAAGVSRAVVDGDFGIAVVGYVVMRMGLVASWLRVAAGHPEGRTRALRFAGGITVLQVLWIANLALPEGVGPVSFAVLALGELAVPVWAESALGQPLFHPHHIEERYGLFTILVLGESLLSATVGFQQALDSRGVSVEMVVIGLSGLVLAFGCWWLYFDHPGHLSPTRAQGFRWGYGHVLVFASLAALGAGVYVGLEAVEGHGSERVGALAVAVPIAGFLLGIVAILVLTGSPALDIRVVPKVVGAVVIVAVGLVAPVTVTAVVAAVLVASLVVYMVTRGDDPPLDEPL